MAKPRAAIVVAGQTPPPLGGQNIMIQRIVDELSSDSRWRTIYLRFNFTPSFQNVRRFRLAKAGELVLVWVRFLLLAARFGRPDLVLYPSGGPQTVPVVRDLLLLPLICALSRRVAVQFHAAGVADRLEINGILECLLRKVYRPVQSAIVMTHFNRRDPEALGIGRIEVVPHRLPDENKPGRTPVYSACGTEPFRILYAGHLYDQKGTPTLVEAFARVAPDFPAARLVLLGEFLAPYSETECLARCEALGIADRVEVKGILRGNAKAEIFASAHLFAFPSIAPYESFGLVLIEAMMWGLPVVATEWRGNRDVAGEVALYADVESDLVSSLAEVLRTSLANPDELAIRSKLARARYESLFRRDETSRDYADLIDRLLSK